MTKAWVSHLPERFPAHPSLVRSGYLLNRWIVSSRQSAQEGVGVLVVIQSKIQDLLKDSCDVSGEHRWLSEDFRRYMEGVESSLRVRHGPEALHMLRQLVPAGTERPDPVGASDWRTHRHIIDLDNHISVESCQVATELALPQSSELGFAQVTVHVPRRE